MNDGYSICFNEWALDKDINGELGLLLIISSLCAEKGYCYASNEYLSKLFNTTETTITRKLRKLKEKNYITVEYKKRGSEIIERNIRLTKMYVDHLQNCKSTTYKIVRENNITTNNINNNNEEINKERKKNIELVIDYLNLVVGTKYRASASATKHINARFDEGYELDDFYDVIDNKYEEWHDTDMEKYLRPDTLFGTKFDIYLNQKK